MSGLSLEQLEDRLNLGSASPTAVALTLPPPAVWTDKLDYHPNSTAIITGSGFAAGETVALQVLHTDATPRPINKGFAALTSNLPAIVRNPG